MIKQELSNGDVVRNDLQALVCELLILLAYFCQNVTYFVGFVSLQSIICPFNGAK